MIKYYQSRFTGDTLPMKGDPLHFSSLLAISKDKLSDSQVDQMFVGYTSYNEETKDGDTTKLTLGVPYVKFGTAYFPYSTLGENFEKWHMPGMSKESYWPLAADVVKNYKLFADDIKRDLRILKAMGFQTVRLHHLEMLYSLDEPTRDAFLDFYFGELKHLGLTALIDVKLKPEQTAALVKRYRPQIDGVEVDNEVLIFGIPDSDIAGWKETYKQVKAIAPDLPIHFTGQTNTGAFDRLRELGVPFDKVGLHSYCDSLDAIPSTRRFRADGFRLRQRDRQAADHHRMELAIPHAHDARGSRESLSADLRKRLRRAQLPGLLSVPVQRKPRDGVTHAAGHPPLRSARPLAPPAAGGAGVRRPDAQVRRSPIAAATGVCDRLSALRICANGGDEEHRWMSELATLVITPCASQQYLKAPRTLSSSIDGDKTFELPSRQAKHVITPCKLPADAMPGFYHAFIRFESEENVCFLRVDLRSANPGAPQFDKDKGFNPQVNYADGALDYDLNRDIAVVYPDGREKDSRWDMESAWLIAQTLEAASGRVVNIYQMEDLPPALAKSGNLIMVDMPGWNGSTLPTKDAKSWVHREQANAEHGDRLIVAGNDEQSLSIAACDFVLRYWKYAKDSGTRRIPLTDQPIDKGADPAALP